MKKEFNVGDVVWFLHLNKIQERRIRKKTVVELLPPSNKVIKKVSYIIGQTLVSEDNYLDNVDLSLEQCFETKEELLKSM